ncbi:MAG: WD40 repeat domain-containing protein [Acidobacteriota bacterium]
MKGLWLSVVFVAVPAVSLAQVDVSLLPDITIAAQSKAATWAAESPDGLFLASCGEDGTVKVWKAEDWSLYKTISAPGTKKTADEFSPDMERFFETGSDGKVNVRKVGKSAGFGLEKTLPTGVGSVSALAISSDGAVLAAAKDDIVKLWRLKDYYLKDLKEAAGQVRALAISGDSRYLASASDDETVYVYDLGTKKFLKSFKDEGYPCTAVALSVDGAQIAYGGYSGTLRVRSVSSGAVLRTVPAHQKLMTSCAFSPDGKYLATSSIGGEIKIWRAGTFSLLKTLQGPGSGLLHLTFSYDSEDLIASGTDGTVEIWTMDRVLP